MPSPKSPLRTLQEALKASTQLRGFAQVLLGARAQPEAASPRRIVLVPTTGTYGAPAEAETALRDVELQVEARMWAADVDEAWDLRSRFIRALEEQGAACGAFWQAEAEVWADTPDASQHGEAVTIIFSATFPADRTTESTGQIDSYQLTRT